MSRADASDAAAGAGAAAGASAAVGAGVGGFDALFADLTVDDDEPETGRSRGGRSARAERAPKKNKKTKKAKSARALPKSMTRGAEAAAAGVAAGDAVASATVAAAAAAAAAASAAAVASAASNAAVASAASAIAPAAATAPTAATASRAAIAWGAMPTAPSATPAAKSPTRTAPNSTPAVPAAPASAASDDFAAAIAAAAIGQTSSVHTEDVDDLDLFASSLQSDPAASRSRTASNASSRTSRRPQSSPAPAARRAASGVAGRTVDSVPARRGATSARLSAVRSFSMRPPQRRRRGARTLASMIAMSFAALLAVATSVPSLSLLTPADVQAMALEQATMHSEDGQRVVISGGVLATQTVQSEGYESQTVQEYAEAAGIRADSDFINNPAGTIQWPFAVGVHVGDQFGYRDCAGCSSDHGGQDFNPGLGAEIQAIADGTVVDSTDGGGSLGVVVMIDHVIDGELITSVYAHMEYGSRRFEVGDTVEVADVLGTTGSTGMSTGPHLHFEIRIGGVDGTKVDPLVWLYANTN